MISLSDKCSLYLILLITYFLRISILKYINSESKFSILYSVLSLNKYVLLSHNKDNIIKSASNP